MPSTGHRHVHSPEEIELLIAESRDGGLLEPEEQIRLHRALRLGLRTANQLMVPRSKLAAIDVEMPYDHVLRAVATSPYSRLPVHRGSLDNVLGILHTKDVVMDFVNEGRGSVTSLLRPIVRVRDRMPADRLLAFLRERRSQQAIVVDENGRVQGLITLEDVLAELLGGVADEFKSVRARPPRPREEDVVVIEFAIITGLILLNGLFVAAEFAIVGAPRAAIDARASRGDRLARLVQSVLHDPQKQDRYIATAQLGITLASLGLGMYGEHVLADAIYAWLESSGLPALVLSHGFASVIAVAVLTYFHIVVGEMVPKSLALQKAERLVLWITPPMLWIKNLLYPFVVALNGLGNRLLRIFGVDRQVRTGEHYHTPEELQLIVQESEDLGALRAESGQVLQELFEFGGRTAGEVMVPRVKICGIPIGTPPERIREVLGRMPHTRYPIYEGDLDHIVGVIHIKDLLRLLLHNEAIDPSHARQVPMVPETAPIDSVLGVPGASGSVADRIGERSHGKTARSSDCSPISTARILSATWVKPMSTPPDMRAFQP